MPTTLGSLGFEPLRGHREVVRLIGQIQSLTLEIKQLEQGGATDADLDA